MIPYIKVPDIALPFGLKLHPFGILVATAVMIGSSLAVRRAKKLGYDVVALNSFITWMLIGGFIGGHVFDEIFYHWDEVVRDPVVLLKVWTGLSSFGGFSGALIGILLWKHFDLVKGLGIVKLRPTRSIFAYADLILAVFPVAWIFGRSGCSVVHDHPGARALGNTMFAVAYPFAGAHAPWRPEDLKKIELVFSNGNVWPTGGSVTVFPRYDLGALELLFTIVIAAAFVLTWRRKLPVGTYIVATAFAYAPVRFAMDFLRVAEGKDAGDTRHFGLTFAQWECIALIAIGVGSLIFMRRMKDKGIDLADQVRPPTVELNEKAPESAT